MTEKNKLPGIAAAAGAAYAYKRYDDKVKERHRWERYGYYDDCRYDDWDRNDRFYYKRYDRDRDYRSHSRSGRYSRR